MLTLRCVYAVVVVELPQMPENNLRNTRATHGIGHSWRMCVVSHGYGGLVGAGMEVVDGKNAGQSRGVGRMTGDAGALSECKVIH